MTNKTQPGFTVDRSGNSVIDPTANVQALSEASNKRQDDLRELAILRLTSDIQNLKEHIRDLMVERDKRYEQRYTDQQRSFDDSLAAEKEAVTAALAASDKAVTKAEVAAEKRFEESERRSAQQATQQLALMPRTEAESRLNMLAEKIGVLEGFRTEVLSKGSGAKEGYGLAIGMVGLVLVVLSIIGGAIVLFSRLG
jgi:hypothetical protein